MVLKWDDAVTAARHCRGLQPGKQVTVLDEVDFAEYSARDQGTPNRVEALTTRKLSTDTESLTCLNGAPHPTRQSDYKESGRLLSIDVPAQLCTVQFRGVRQFEPTAQPEARNDLVVEIANQARFRFRVEVPVRHLRLSHADELTESPDHSVSRQRKAPPPEEESYASDWMDFARVSPRGPRRSRSDSSGRRGPQVPDDTNLQPGVAALRDMLGMVRPGYRPADAAQQPTETGWSILSSTAPYSSLSMLATPWKTRRYEDQLDTPSTVATDSPIDMIWSPRRRWVYEGPAQLVTELPGACRSPHPDSAMTPPRRTRAWLSNPPFSHRVEPQMLLPHTSPPRYAGLRPPGNLLGSISTLPTVTTVPFSPAPGIAYGQNHGLLCPVPPM
ncbi:unnamed protein product [Symbiodinium sp. CCMP2456]|nr:unnamed protein product [Symbiodinium sp. CCMP2456]